MPEQGLPTPEEARKELARHLAEEGKKDPDFFKKHDARIAKENPVIEEEPKR
ncbi:MAG: hypothetical protein V1668_04925 [Patescibacteria group bacterium]